jgi:hypothetical protein
LKNLDGNSDLHGVSLEELEKITNEYPYFSVSHILLANKLQLEGDERFEKQAQKAALYTLNPWSLHYLLTNELEALTAQKSAQQTTPAVTLEDKSAIIKTEDEKVSETMLAVTPPEDREKVLLTDGDDNVTPETLLTQDTTLPALQTEEVIKEEDNLLLTDEDDDVDPGFAREEITETNDDEKLHAGIEEDEELVVDTNEDKDSDHQEATLPVQVIPGILENALPTESVPITTEFTQEELEVADKLAHETLAEVDPETGSSLSELPATEEPEVNVPITTEFTQKELDESSRLAYEALAETNLAPNIESLFVLPVATEERVEQEIEPTDQVVNSEPIGTESEPKMEEATSPIKQPQAVVKLEEPAQPPSIFSEEEFLNEEEENTDEEPGIDIDDSSPEAYSNNQMLQNIKSILDTPLATNKAAAQSLIPIDPYYTVDYFASQGIKLVLDNDPTDKLGKKLKKFTQWLKHMKKLGPEDAIESETEDDSEAMVIRIADFSNTQREVITEAMAAVLEKQGKKEKAIQIYIKLSFLYPDKSAYFADKIKILKGIK